MAPEVILSLVLLYSIPFIFLWYVWISFCVCKCQKIPLRGNSGNNVGMYENLYIEGKLPFLQIYVVFSHDGSIWMSKSTDKQSFVQVFYEDLCAAISKSGNHTKLPESDSILKSLSYAVFILQHLSLLEMLSGKSKHGIIAQKHSIVMGFSKCKNQLEMHEDEESTHNMNRLLESALRGRKPMLYST